MISSLKDKYFRWRNKRHLNASHKVYLSFGENCLPDHILNRYALKSFTTPFSHGRSNVEYILNLERDDYTDFLNLDYLSYEYLNEDRVQRLKKYTEKD